jgi:uncharacterized membrane protein
MADAVTTEPVPQTVAGYLQALKSCLKGQPAALVLDALADAEEYLRAEQASVEGETEQQMLARVVETYGSPHEVAQEYITMEKASNSPFPAREEESDGPGFFGILVDPAAYGSLIYMLLSLATGIFYFTWVVAGVSLSLGLAILIIGVPFALLFIGSVRVISWVEGRIVETLLGVRMPRRMPSQDSGGTLWSRIKHALSDARTWGSMFYMLLQLPLGIIYFTLSVALGVTSGALIAGGIHQLATGQDHIMVTQRPEIDAFLNTPPGLVLVVIVGLIGILLTLHVARALGIVHGKIAETLLVRA